MKIRSELPRRPGLSLVELVVSMGLLSILMLPIIGLLATSHKVYNASNVRHDGNYARHIALDAVAARMGSAVRVVSANPSQIDVQLASGAVGRLTYSRGVLAWRVGTSVEVLARGLANARFSVGAVAGAGPAAGELVSVEVATRGTGEPADTWSSTNVWVKPTI